MYPAIKQLTNEWRTVIVQFDGPGAGEVLFCTDDEYSVGECLDSWREDRFSEHGLDNTKVRLSNGEIARLKFKEATIAREACYESVCMSHRFDLMGRSTCREKYNVSRIEGLTVTPEYKEPIQNVDDAVAAIKNFLKP